MNKLKLSIFSLMIGGTFYAQTGKVGINTETPNETLEINGTLRVNNLPESGSGKIYDGLNNTEAKTTFTGTNMVVSDDKGNLGTLPFVTYPTLLAGGKREDVAPNTQIIRVRAASETVYTENLSTAQFTLDKKSMVIFNSTLSINVLSNYLGTSIRDGVLRRLGSALYLNNEIVAINAMPFYTYDTTSITFLTGQFYSNIQKVLILDAGTYNVRLEGSLNTNSSDRSGIRAEFGPSGYDILDIVAYPVL